MRGMEIEHKAWSLRVAVAAVALAGCAHSSHTTSSMQLLVVVTEGWDSPVGVSTLYERDGTGWRVVATAPAVVGKNGLGWGLGVGAPLPREADEPLKKEGDGKAPAGLFRIGAAFGLSPLGGEWPFRPLKATTECVDDVGSVFYNQTVENDAVTVDWKSSEKMASEPLYRVGAFVEHNTAKPAQGAGSCIFLHVWRAQGRGTAGCTAFDESALRTLLTSLRPQANAMLIQLPRSIYEAQRVSAGWP